VFEQGEPAKKHYRRFKIKTVEGANDVASLSEVLQRRFARADDTGQTDEPESTEQTSAEPTNNDETWAVLPDLILIDGGIGQVNAAAKTLAAAGFEHIPVVGLVKGDTKGHLPYGLVKPGQRVPIAFAQNDPGLHLVQRIDEEAHRFAISYHRKLRTKGMLRSTMEDIPGIGPKRKKALINAFGSLEGIRNASIEELAAVPGMTRKAAEEIKGLL